MTLNQYTMKLYYMTNSVVLIWYVCLQTRVALYSWALVEYFKISYELNYKLRLLNQLFR